MTDTQRWLAPRDDGAILAVPPLREVGRLALGNRRKLADSPLRILGRPLSTLREQAGREARLAAIQYLQDAGEPIPVFSSGTLFLAGHQPELFHPGVWVKNFALHGLARTHNATPINLVVDNDTVKSAAVRLPRGELPDVHLATLPFDHATGEVPYEERTVHDEALFATFGERGMDALRSWNYRPMLADWWAEVQSQTARTPLLGERFAAARRATERRWGCHNLEVPLSALCRTESFAVFALHILGDLPRFHHVYNEAVHAYRRRYGIKSRNHPVPDLARDGDWLEAPFWAWRAGATRRGRLFARTTADGISLRTGNEAWPTVKRGDIAAWQNLERAAFKVRTRALTTTLFARLLLADLFIHGIGGGKYDELTDDLMRAFFETEAPGFMVLSATLHLPIPAYAVEIEQRRRQATTVRDLYYNPQRYLHNERDGEVRELVAQKREWIEREPANAAEKEQRFHAIRALGDQLRPRVADDVAAGRMRLAQTDRELAANAVLQRRDYAFCLFPEAKLRPFCVSFLRPEG